jgi:hypothetical protein
MAHDETASSRKNAECFQDTSASHVSRLVKDLNDRYTRGSENDTLSTLDTDIISIANGQAVQNPMATVQQMAKGMVFSGIGTSSAM